MTDCIGCDDTLPGLDPASIAAVKAGGSVVIERTVKPTERPALPVPDPKYFTIVLYIKASPNEDVIMDMSSDEEFGTRVDPADYFDDLDVSDIIGSVVDMVNDDLGWDNPTGWDIEASEKPFSDTPAAI